MKIGILGTGGVGRTIGAKLVARGHAVMIGTRDAAATLARSEADMYGNPPFSAWLKQQPAIRQQPGIRLGSFAEAAAFGEMVFNCTAGGGSLAALEQAGAQNLAGKPLVDIANPLDFSHGMPPTLLVSNNDSLGEQIQRAFPGARVVKTLNTMTAMVMVNPAMLPGEHDVFVSGNDAAAKARVTALLKEDFGWRSVIDLGDISTARGVEMYLPFWLHVMGAVNSPMFNIHIVR